MVPCRCLNLHLLCQRLLRLMGCGDTVEVTPLDKLILERTCISVVRTYIGPVALVSVQARERTSEPGTQKTQPKDPHYWTLASYTALVLEGKNKLLMITCRGSTDCIVHKEKQNVSRILTIYSHGPHRSSSEFIANLEISFERHPRILKQIL